MTIQDRIELINEAIAKSLRHESHIDADILKITGFSTGVMRRLFNWLARIGDNPVYVELGLYAGGTFCAAINNSPKLIAYGVENRSQPFGSETVFEELSFNIKRFKDGAKEVHFIDADIFQLDLDQIKHKATTFFYDGEHSRESQAKAIPYYYDILDDVCLIVIDDYQWPDVYNGTADGFEVLKDKLKIERQWVLSEGRADSPVFHNGLGLFLCSKVNTKQSNDHD